MYRIEIIQNKTKSVVSAAHGEKLSDVLIKSGFSVSHPCSGMGMCKKCTVLVNGKKELSCQYAICSDAEIVLPEKEEIASFCGEYSSAVVTENLCFVLDIGTTTLAMALVSLDEKNIICAKTSVNPQRAFGADVVSRIECCRKNGVNELQSAVVEKVNKMIADVSDEYNVSVKKMYVAGNTTMLHLFFGIDCSDMGVSPYTPSFLGSRTEKGADIGIKNVQEIISLPNISAFVGADIVAGLNFVGVPEKNKYNILIDLGTNAEIVLYSDKKILCTAAAAGPCFECANISSGMSATKGAVYAYSADRIQTIGNEKAQGICATGLIDIIAELLKNETIDETGSMDCGKFRIAENVFLTREDVRQFQLAKSAVYSAIITLMKMQNVSFADIEKVFIAGGFSSGLDISNAIATGLLPLELKSKYVVVNNSSLLGAADFAAKKSNLSVFTENAEYVDLAENPMFSELFIKNMMFTFYI